MSQSPPQSQHARAEYMSSIWRYSQAKYDVKIPLKILYVMISNYNISKDRALSTIKAYVLLKFIAHDVERHADYCEEHIDELTDEEYKATLELNGGFKTIINFYEPIINCLIGELAEKHSHTREIFQENMKKWANDFGEIEGAERNKIENGIDKVSISCELLYGFMECPFIKENKDLFEYIGETMKSENLG